MYATYSTDLTSDYAGLFRDRWDIAKVKYQAKSNKNKDFNLIQKHKTKFIEE